MSDFMHWVQAAAAEHLCAQSSVQMEARHSGKEDRKEHYPTGRLLPVSAAVVLSVSAFSFIVAHIYWILTRRRYWANATVAVLALLLYVGRRSGHKLGRTVAQIRVLCMLALT
ncbi:hypothetical protein MSAN_00657100 [Mycena sanguinolenta]|uniref:Uncharacterized protein n=1 Tax=Mycena sanguinolenta TaxID=230812 RepID=A0A8H6Z077_9AGAR|nr:hypothetical protein MSAN_00657100 [Mycena sanguinolenta]